MHSQLLGNLYLLIVSLNKSLKRNKLESQGRYHKCIIEQKQTKVANLLVDSVMNKANQIQWLILNNKAMLRASWVVQV